MRFKKPFILKNCQGILNSNIFPIVAILVVLALILFRKYNKPTATRSGRINTLSIKKDFCRDMGGKWDSSHKKCSIENLIANSPELTKIKKELNDIRRTIKNTRRTPAGNPSPLPLPVPAPPPPPPPPVPAPPPPPLKPTPPPLARSPSAENSNDEHCPNNYKIAQCKKVIWGTPCPNGTAQGSDRKQWYYATQEKIWGGKIWCYKCSPKAIPLFKPILPGSNCATLEELKYDKKDYKDYNKFIEDYRVEIIDSAQPTELHQL